MRVAFVMNYLSIHQVDISDVLYELIGDNFKFVSAYGPSGYKKTLNTFEYKDYVIRAYESSENKELAIDIINNSDICVSGVFDKSLLGQRHKPIIRESEHLFRTNLYFLNPLSLLRLFHLHCLLRKEYKNGGCLLCNSFYSKKDFNASFLYKDRTFKFGYFPKGSIGIPREHQLFSNEPIKILWSGRFLKLKHPEIVLECADILKSKHIKFEINVVSPISEKLTRKMKRLLYKIQNERNISFIPGLPHEKLLDLMRKSDIFVFSSDRGEGFGATLYEAMSSGCCCFASKRAGGSRLLIKDQFNGFLYSNKRDFKNVFLSAIKDKDNLRQVGEYAKKFIETKYSPRVAANNLLSVFVGGKTASFFELCSKY